MYSTSLKTNVLYYRGADGIKQMTWNSLRAKKNIDAYVFRFYQEAVGQKFLERWAEDFRKSKIYYREIRYTGFDDEVREAGSSRVMLNLGMQYEHREIDKDVLALTHNIDIYDDVTAIYYWKDKELFGIEIHNQEIADMQRSMFEVFWKMAEKYEDQTKEMAKAWEGF